MPTDTRCQRCGRTYEGATLTDTVEGVTVKVCRWAIPGGTYGTHPFNSVPLQFPRDNACHGPGCDATAAETELVEISVAGGGWIAKLCRTCVDTAEWAYRMQAEHNMRSETGGYRREFPNAH